MAADELDLPQYVDVILKHWKLTGCVCVMAAIVRCSRAVAPAPLGVARGCLRVATVTKGQP